MADDPLDGIKSAFVKDGSANWGSILIALATTALGAIGGIFLGETTGAIAWGGLAGLLVGGTALVSGIFGPNSSSNGGPNPLPVGQANKPLKKIDAPIHSPTLGGKTSDTYVMAPILENMPSPTITLAQTDQDRKELAEQTKRFASLKAKGEDAGTIETEIAKLQADIQKGDTENTSFAATLMAYKKQSAEYMKTEYPRLIQELQDRAGYTLQQAKDTVPALPLLEEQNITLPKVIEDYAKNFNATDNDQKTYGVQTWDELSPLSKAVYASNEQQEKIRRGFDLVNQNLSNLAPRVDVSWWNVQLNGHRAPTLNNFDGGRGKINGGIMAANFYTKDEVQVITDGKSSDGTAEGHLVTMSNPGALSNPAEIQEQNASNIIALLNRLQSDPNAPALKNEQWGITGIKTGNFVDDKDNPETAVDQLLRYAKMGKQIAEGKIVGQKSDDESALEYQSVIDYAELCKQKQEIDQAKLQTQTSLEKLIQFRDDKLTVAKNAVNKFLGTDLPKINAEIDARAKGESPDKTAGTSKQTQFGSIPVTPIKGVGNVPLDGPQSPPPMATNKTNGQTAGTTKRYAPPSL